MPTKMKRFCLKISFLILGVAIILFGFGIRWSFVWAASPLDELQGKMRSLEQQIQDLENQAKAYQAVIRKKETNINTLSARISLFNNRIKKLENDINLTAQEISLKNLLIQSLGLEIDQALLNIGQKKVALANLIKAINDLDQKGIVVILFTGERLSDFFDQAQYMSKVHQKLNVTLVNLVELKRNLEAKKQEAEKEKERLEGLKRRASVQHYALAQQRRKQKELLQKTKGEEKAYQAMLRRVAKQRADLLRELAITEKEIARQKNFLFYSQAKTIPPAGTLLFRWPERNAILTQGYGMTAFAKTGAYGGAGHNGIDMSAGLGSPILAAADGEILVSGTNRGWGNWVAIKHPNGMVTLYAHMIKPTFRRVGEAVEAGDVIGYEGATGFVTGPHLHFSVYYKFFTYLKNGQVYFNYFDGTLNPLNYM